MIIGIPKEIKDNENRVGMTPSGVASLTESGHLVYVEQNAGVGSGIDDSDYVKAGAVILNSAQDVYSASDMIVKVKEPLEPEFELIKEGQILYTYLHLASEPKLALKLMEKKAVAIAYETVQLRNGSLPLLTPMSEVAGKMSVQIGAKYLEKHWGGRGVLLGGVPGVEPGIVVIIGGGIVGVSAAKIAVGMGAQVTILEKNADRLRYLDDLFGGKVKILYSTPYAISQEALKADLLIGAVLITGAKAPKLVTEETVKKMKIGSVIVDVAIDQGGSIETIDRVTTHSDPVFIKHGVVHYSVANIPGAVARTSTFALTNATMPYCIELASKGWERAATENDALALGVNVAKGKLVYKAVAEALGIEYTPLSDVLNQV